MKKRSSKHLLVRKQCRFGTPRMQIYQQSKKGKKRLETIPLRHSMKHCELAYVKDEDFGHIGTIPTENSLI